MLPEAFLERMERMLGEEYNAFLRTFEEDRYQALRLNALKQNGDGKSAAGVYGAPEGGAAVTCFGSLTAVPWAENGYYYEPADRPGKHPCHEAGLYYIQEPSAMLPAELLKAEPGDRVLDLCAAPGGKSTQLAAKLKGRGFLLCNEIHPGRAKILSENIERMGIRNACVVNETPEHLAERLPGFFNRILVDAPCSGEGMFRKNETACLEWSPENVRLCAERQDKILDCAAGMLQPGGRLVYSTCTFSAEENEGSIERFLARHGEFREVPTGDYVPGSCPGMTENCREPSESAPALSRDAGKGMLRLWPHKIKGEGHFAAVLEKEGSLPECWKNSAPDGVPEGVPEREPGEYKAFCRENLSETCLACLKTSGQDASREDYHYVRFGDNLYLVSDATPDLKGLKVLRPGLHLGELKKNRFEPSHALALALSPMEVLHVCNLSWEDPAVMAYLRGQTFPAEGEKGWYLICADGFSLGWGKLAGGIMKNHYPRGLRI